MNGRCQSQKTAGIMASKWQVGFFPLHWILPFMRMNQLIDGVVQPIQSVHMQSQGGAHACGDMG